jgi:hypothetical protein
VSEITVRPDDAAAMREAYVSRGLSLPQLAKAAGLSPERAAWWLGFHRIKLRTAAEAYALRSHPDIRARRTQPPPRRRRGEVSYATAHARMRQDRGKAAEHQCRHCDQRAEQWAYDWTDPNEIASFNGPYSLDQSKYLPLCRACHERFDADHHRRNRS